MKYKKDNQNIYTNNIDYESKVFDLDKSRLEKILKLLNSLQKTESGNILDIGCLTGKLLSKTKSSWNKYGIDLINKPINIKKNIHYIKHDVEKKFPFKDGFFDIIIAGEVIEHLYDTDMFLQELHRVLKKNGFLLISTPNLNSLINRFLILFGKYPRYLEYKKGGAGHIRSYNLNILTLQLRKNNFYVLKRQGNFLSLPDPTKKKIFRNSLYKPLGNIFPSLSENIIVLVMKK